MRVLEAAAEGVGKALAPDCAVTYAYGATYSHQVIVPDNFYPGAVMEQIAIQNNGLAASFRRDFSIGKNAYVYSVDLDLARQTEITKCGYLVQLGLQGKFRMLPVEQRMTFETIYAYGFSGVASAQAEGKQPFADELACPSDLVRIIADATELRAAHSRQGMDIIKSYGRWGDGTDIAFIYVCVTARTAEQLRATDRLDARG